MTSRMVNLTNNKIHNVEISQDIHTNVTKNYIEVTNINQKKPRNFKFNLPPLVHITGRDEEVKELTELIKIERRVVIAGMGGVGKTTLSAHCARKWSEGSIFKRWFQKFEHVIFVDTETDITMENSIKKLCKHPKIGFNSYESNERAYFMELVYQKFTRGNLLIIFDNVISFPSVQNFLPPLERYNITTVFTSQNIEFDSSFYVYKLKVLSKNSCLELIKDQFGEQWTEVENQLETIEQLMERLQFLPLAVCQAVAHVKDQLTYGDKNYTIKHYLDNFETNFKNSFPEYKDDVYKKSAFTAIDMNISLLKQNQKYGEKAKLVLYCIGYLDPSSISEELLLPLFGLRGNDVTEVKRLLHKYSLVDLDNSTYMNIHRLIQETCRILTKNDGEFVLYFKNVLKEVLSSDIYKSHLQFLKPYIENYGIAVLNELFVELYNSGSRRKILEDTFDSAQCDITAVEEWTVVNYAVFEANEELLYLLKSTGHNLTVVCVFEMLHLITLNKNSHLRTILELTLGNINKQNSEGNTVLHLILSDVNQCTGWGECKYCTIVLQLIQAGSDINFINKDGDTAANLAIENNHTEISLHILQHCRTDIFLKRDHDIDEWRLKDYISFFKFIPKNENRPFYEVMYMEPLCTIQEGLELLKEQVGQSAPDSVWEEIVGLFDNVPEALRLAAVYIRSRELPVTDFQEHFMRLSEDAVTQAVSGNFYGYRLRNVCILLCGILESIRYEHNLSYVLLTYASCVENALYKYVLYSFLNDASHENVETVLEVLHKSSLLEKSDCNNISKLVRFTTLMFGHERGELEAVCTTLITRNYDEHFPVRYLGESGVRKTYTDRYRSESAYEHWQLDKLCKTGAVTEADIDQFSGLHWAAVYNHQAVTRELLALGSAVNAATDRGVTPLHIARGCLFPDVAYCLRKTGGGVDRCDVDGRTPDGWHKLAWN